jgi:Zn-dependent protease with chaperone function
MFGNLLYFIVVLLIWSTYQPPLEPQFHPLEILGLFVGLAIVFVVLTRWQFRVVGRRIGRNGAVRLDHAFHGALTRQCIMAVGLFAIDIYGLHLPGLLDGFAVFQVLPTLEAFVMLAVFVAYLTIVWAIGFDVYRRIYPDAISRRVYLRSQIDMSLPIMAPWAVFSLVSDLINALPLPRLKAWLASPAGEIIYFAGFLTVLAVLGPVLVQKMWRCRPVEGGPLRRRIENLCRSAGVGYRDILYWPIMGGRMITAGITGLAARFRYILVTPALMAHLQTEEIEAVIAHELGHVQKYHLHLYLVLFAGYMVITFAGFDLLLYLGLYTSSLQDMPAVGGLSETTVLSAMFALAVIGLFVIYFRFVFGFFMRNFERQADAYVFHFFNSAEALIRTFHKIALLNGQSMDRPNWHHFSISQRIGFLQRCQTDRGLIHSHDRKIRRSLGIFAAGLALVAVMGYQLKFGETGRHINRHFSETMLQRLSERRPHDPFLLGALGDLRYSCRDLAGAQQAYEQALMLDQNHPSVLNNLAWLYATSPDPGLRNPVRALELALAAARLRPESHVLDTLAESYFVNGRYPEALAAARWALATGDGDPVYLQQQIARFEAAAREMPGRP